MKSAFVPVAAVVAGVAAQDLSSLPQCGQICVNNLIAQGPSLGCTQATPLCLCSAANFAWGIHDCSAEFCPPGTNLQEINQYGLSYCESAQASDPSTTLAALGIFSSVVATGSTASPSASATTTTTASEVSTTTTSSGGSGSTTTTTSRTTTASSSSSSSHAVTTITSGGTTRESTVGDTSTSVESESSSAGAGAGPRPRLPLVGGPPRRPAHLAAAEALGLGVLGIAGAFWGLGLV